MLNICFKHVNHDNKMGDQMKYMIQSDFNIGNMASPYVTLVNILTWIGHV